jgi:hypothetical protein
MVIYLTTKWGYLELVILRAVPDHVEPWFRPVGPGWVPVRKDVE